jgi:hypothetical protein
MPNATARANARTLPEATSYPDANIRALAAQFETALRAYQAFYHGGGTDDEAAAATDTVKAIAQKIIAVPGTDISIMRLKARVYLWAESTDLEKLAADGGDWPSEAVLASLFRDLGIADLDATPGPAAPASDTAPHPDAEIFALAEKCAECADRRDRLGDAYAAAEAKDREIKPPKTIVKTEADARMGLFKGVGVGFAYRADEIDHIREVMRTSSPSAFLRAREILKALVPWLEEIDAEEARSGVAEARRVCAAASEEDDRLITQMLNLSASTPEGLLAKALSLREHFSDIESLPDEIRDSLIFDGLGGKAIALSIVRDVLRLAHDTLGFGPRQEGGQGGALMNAATNRRVVLPMH